MKYVLAVALADELEGIQGNYNTVITGVGKINEETDEACQPNFRHRECQFHSLANLLHHRV